MKTCPTCGASALDSETVCARDGSVVVAASMVNTLLATRSSGAFCLTCGTRDADDGTGHCHKCGASFDRTTAPGGPGTPIAEFVVAASHGEGDLRVTDVSGATRLLVYGARAAVAAEAQALRALGGTDGLEGGAFPRVVREGHTVEVGAYALLAFSGGDAVPLLDVDLTFAQALSVLRSVLDAAESLARAGYHWEPSLTDLYLKEGGALVAVRARGAQPLMAGESFNAKRTVEPLADLFLPFPLASGTPELVRLLMPRMNYSSPVSVSVAEAREVLARAEAEYALRSEARMVELCDPGLRRNHNEDATALGEGLPDEGGEPLRVLVVCDGVSSSTRAGEASTLAARVARDTLATSLRQGGLEVTHERVAAEMSRAIRAAHLAVCTAGLDLGGGPPPGTTIVAAVVHRGRLTVGWVGDSRAYWISDREAHLCTTDHSWVNDAVASGSVTEAQAQASPFAHALTRCLGPLETSVGLFQDVEPGVRSRPLPGPGHLILCTDGLWNYFPLADQLAVVVRDVGPDADARAVARTLVCRALAEGGGDNVSVAVCAVGQTE